MLHFGGGAVFRDGDRWTLMHLSHELNVCLLVSVALVACSCNLSIDALAISPVWQAREHASRGSRPQVGIGCST